MVLSFFRPSLSIGDLPGFPLPTVHSSLTTFAHAGSALSVSVTELRSTNAQPFSLRAHRAAHVYVIERLFASFDCAPAAAIHLAWS
jgi:hypothetical protein